MRRQWIWMQAALCAVMFSAAAPVMARGAGDPPPHAQAHGKDKNKNKDKNKDKDRDHAKHKHASSAKPWDPRFRGLDRNRNGIVSRAEWDGSDRSFAVHDWNHDGVLSGDELVAGAIRPVERVIDTRRRTESDEVLFARRDLNRDGVISRREWVGTASAFARLDFNRDGVLSPYEYGVGR